MQNDVRIMCPNLRCRKVLTVPDSARGKVVRCRACGTAIRIPDRPPAQPAGTQPVRPDGA